MGIYKTPSNRCLRKKNVQLVTHTSTITTVYKDGRPPSVRCTSNVRITGTQSKQCMMTTRVRRRQPRVPPLKGRQPLPQFGAGVPDRDIWHVLSDIMFPRTKKPKQKGGRIVEGTMSGPFGDLIMTTFGVKNPARQGGDRLSHLNKLGLDLYATTMGVKNRMDKRVGIWR